MHKLRTCLYWKICKNKFEFPNQSVSNLSKIFTRCSNNLVCFFFMEIMITNLESFLEPKIEYCFTSQQRGQYLVFKFSLCKLLIQTIVNTKRNVRWVTYTISITELLNYKTCCYDAIIQYFSSVIQDTVVNGLLRRRASCSIGRQEQHLTAFIDL